MMFIDWGTRQIDYEYVSVWDEKKSCVELMCR